MQVNVPIFVPVEMPIQASKSVSFAPVQVLLIWSNELTCSSFAHNEANVSSARYSVFVSLARRRSEVLTMTPVDVRFIVTFRRSNTFDGEKLWLTLSTGVVPE